MLCTLFSSVYSRSTHAIVCSGYGFTSVMNQTCLIASRPGWTQISGS